MPYSSAPERWVLPMINEVRPSVPISLIHFNPNTLEEGEDSTALSLLERLPAEILINIFHLSMTISRINLAQASKHLARLSQNQGVLLFDFSYLSTSDFTTLQQVLPYHATVADLPEIMLRPSPGMLPSAEVNCFHCTKSYEVEYFPSTPTGERIEVSPYEDQSLSNHTIAELGEMDALDIFNKRKIPNMLFGMLRILMHDCERQHYRNAFLTLKYRQS